MNVKLDPETKRALDDAAAHDAALDLEPQAPPSRESVSDAPLEDAENGTGSPLSLEKAHEQLILRATALTKEVQYKKETSEAATKRYRKARDELAELNRGIRALGRTRHVKPRAT